MPRTKTIEVFHYKELEGTAKAHALNWWLESSLDHDWYDSIYDDAKTIGLKITSFDIYRGRHAKGSFTQDALKVAHAILENHGEACETTKTARDFLAEYNKLVLDVPVDYADTETPWPESYEFENQAEDIKNEFLKSILEDYSIMLQKESEYLTSEEYMEESMEGNEYEFTADGRRA